MMHTTARFAVLTALTVLCLTGCDHEGTSSPEPKSDWTGLLSDEELLSDPDPTAPSENPTWIAWMESNHIPIRSLEAENFVDLEPLRPLLTGRRLVQLGEASHGAAEFSRVKTRLIKFLNQELGFDVIAFESSVFECFQTDGATDRLAALEMMRHSIFGVWHTTDVQDLFAYIRDSRHSSTPLTLAGFDTQISSLEGVASRPEFLRAVLTRTDRAYADTVAAFDREFLRDYGTSGMRVYLQEHGDLVTQRYENLAVHLEAELSNRVLLRATEGDSLLIAYRIARSMVCLVEQLLLQHEENTAYASYVRDQGMAENLTALLDLLYPDRKVIVWAHNYHVRHNNQRVHCETQTHLRTMGHWIVERFRAEMYTIGLYMYRGQVADHEREVYDIAPAVSGSLESILYRARRRHCFVDLLGQTEEAGNGWMFIAIPVKSYGTLELQMVPRDQYDGILFVDTVSAPHYYP